MNWEKAGAWAAGGPIGGMLYNNKDMFGGGGPSYDQAMIDRRTGQINELAANLAKSRAGFASSLQNMYSNAFNTFGGNAEAKFGARGLQVTGGGFQAELARKAAEYQSQMDTEIYGNERQDLMAVDNARAGLFGTNMQADMQDRMQKLQSRQAMMQGLGNFAGQAGLAYATGGASLAIPKPGFTPGKSAGGLGLDTVAGRA